MQYGNLTIQGRTPSFNGKPVKLSSAETEYLLFLARHAGKTMNKDQILHGLYSKGCPLYIDGTIPEPKIVDVIVCKIRKKMQKVSGQHSPINTVWGQGYNLPAPVKMAA